MGAGRGRTFDRKLEAVLVARLRAGHEPEGLLAELKTRMGDAEADAVLSRAEACARTPREPDARLADRLLAGLAYLWIAILVLQNLVIVATVVGELNAAIPIGFSAEIFIPALAAALLKVGLLCAGAFAYKRWRSAATTALFCLSVLYAFPAGLYIDPLFTASAPVADGATLVSLSAICSYVAVLLIACVYWRQRERISRPAPVSVFD